MHACLCAFCTVSVVFSLERWDFPAGFDHIALILLFFFDHGSKGIVRQSINREDHHHCAAPRYLQFLRSSHSDPA